MLKIFSNLTNIGLHNVSKLFFVKVKFILIFFEYSSRIILAESEVDNLIFAISQAYYIEAFY